MTTTETRTLTNVTDESVAWTDAAGTVHTVEARSSSQVEWCTSQVSSEHTRDHNGEWRGWSRHSA